MAEETGGNVEVHQTRVPQRTDTIIHSFLRAGLLFEKPPTDNPISSEDRTLYLNRVREGQYRDEQYAFFLNSIKRHDPSKNKDELFDDIDNPLTHQREKNRMKKFLSYYRFNTSERYEEIQATDVGAFLNEQGENVLDFEKKRDEYLTIVGKLNDPAKVKEYQQALATLGKKLYGKQWVYLEQIRLLEEQALGLDNAEVDSVHVGAIAYPDIAFPPIEPLRSRPQYGSDADWRLLDNEWRLTPKGAQTIKTEGETQMNSPELHFDLRGRPFLMWNGETSANVHVTARFEQGAALREAEDTTNAVTLSTYEQARERIAKVGSGLFMFATYITKAPPEKAEAALQKVYGEQIRPEYLKYVKELLPFFGTYHYLQEELMIQGFDGQTADPIAPRVLTADDVLGEWLRQERQFSLLSRGEGRDMLFIIAKQFEAGSRNDIDWTRPNDSLIQQAKKIGERYFYRFGANYPGFRDYTAGIPDETLDRFDTSNNKVVNPWT